MSAATARTVRGMMIDVVRLGTGQSAAIPGVTVAGKTGTAELGGEGTACPSGSEAASTQATATNPETHETEASACASEQSNPKNTDAWFAAFAPATHPKVVVAVLLVKDGFGGETAAPVARQVLEAALAR
jgi:peptidoglycan glycosyltransferase